MTGKYKSTSSGFVTEESVFGGIICAPMRAARKYVYTDNVTTCLKIFVSYKFSIRGKNG